MPSSDSLVPFQAGKPPSRIQRLKQALAAPFKLIEGGPLFDDCTLRRIDCGPIELTFFEPRAYFGSGPRPEKVDLADDAAFDRVADEDRTGHRFVKIGGSNWNYRYPRYRPGLEQLMIFMMREPYVIITAYWQLERVKHGITLDADDPDALEAYLHKDYATFMEAEGGINWRLRTRRQKQFGPEGRNWPQEVIDEEINRALHSPPSHFERLTFRDATWLRYAWKPGRVPDAWNYTRAIAPCTLFTFKLSVVPMRGSEKVEARCREALLRDGDALMEGLTIRDKRLPPGESMSGALPGPAV